MFVSALIGCDGASAAIGASFVAYSAAAKVALLGVSADTIARTSEVSEETAIEMARGAARVAGASVGVGITGYAGRKSGASPQDGTVCFGFIVQGFPSSVKVRFIGDRNSIRKQATTFALNSLYSMIK